MKELGIIKAEPTQENGLIPVELGDGSLVYAQWMPNSEPTVGTAVNIEKTAAGSLMATAKNSHNWNQLFKQSGLQKYAQRADWDVDFVNGKIWNEPIKKTTTKISWAFLAAPIFYKNPDAFKGTLYYVTDLGITKIEVPDVVLFPPLVDMGYAVQTEVSFFIDPDDDNFIGFWVLYFVPYRAAMIAYYDSSGSLVFKLDLSNLDGLEGSQLSYYSVYKGTKSIRLAMAYVGNVDLRVAFQKLEGDVLTNLGFQEWDPSFSDIRFFNTVNTIGSPNGNSIENKVMLIKSDLSSTISTDLIYDNLGKLSHQFFYLLYGEQKIRIKSTPGFLIAYPQTEVSTITVAKFPLAISNLTENILLPTIDIFTSFNICKVEKISDGFLKYKGTVFNADADDASYYLSVNFSEPEKVTYDYGFSAIQKHNSQFGSLAGIADIKTVIYSDNGSIYDLELGSVNSYKLSDGGVQFRHLTFDPYLDKPSLINWVGDFFYRTMPFDISEDIAIVDFVTEVLMLTQDDTEDCLKFSTYEIESQEISVSGLSNLNSFLLSPLYVTEKFYEETINN